MSSLVKSHGDSGDQLHQQPLNPSSSEVSVGHFADCLQGSAHTGLLQSQTKLGAARSGDQMPETMIAKRHLENAGSTNHEVPGGRCELKDGKKE